MPSNENLARQLSSGGEVHRDDDSVHLGSASAQERRSYQPDSYCLSFTHPSHLLRFQSTFDGAAHDHGHCAFSEDPLPERTSKHKASPEGPSTTRPCCDGFDGPVQSTMELPSIHDHCCCA